jgi:hypothetical protein
LDEELADVRVGDLRDATATLRKQEQRLRCRASLVDECSSVVLRIVGNVVGSSEEILEGAR